MTEKNYMQCPKCKRIINQEDMVSVKVLNDFFTKLITKRDYKISQCCNDCIKDINKQRELI